MGGGSNEGLEGGRETTGRKKEMWHRGSRGERTESRIKHVEGGYRSSKAAREPAGLLQDVQGPCGRQLAVRCQGK